MAEPVSGIQVVIDDEGNEPRVDPVTGTIETDQDDGGVIVQLDARRPKQQDEEPDGFDENLCDKIDAALLSKIAVDLHEQIEADDKSRGNYLEIRARAMGLLGLELKEPRASVGDTSAAVEGMSTVTNPLLLEACLKGWANAEAELLPSEGPVKVDDEGSVEAEEELAEAYERDANYFFTEVMTEYYPDTSHMLLWGTYFGGSGIKKVYRDPLLRRPTSQSVDVKDFIVSDTTKDLKSCQRLTHQVEMRPSVMKRMQLAGAYRDVSLQEPAPVAPGPTDAKIAAIQGTNPTAQRREDQPYILWESQCELDLPDFAPGKFKDEGIPLPYLVTIDKESKQVLAIRRDWKEEDEECQRKRMYVKFPYVPGPGFYGTGLLNILGNCSSAMTAAWREALDTGMFANFPSFLIAKLSGRQNTSDLRVGPGTGVPIETNGQPINAIAAPMPYKDVTPGLLALMDKITQQAESVGGVADIPTSEGIQNVPVGTMLAQIEQATKVMAAAHRGQYKAQAEEIGLILDLLRENPEDFWRSNKKCRGYWDEAKFEQALNDCQLVPRADPNTPSHIHRVAKALAIAQMGGMPFFAPVMDPVASAQRIFAIIREDPTGIIRPPPQAAAPQGPDPQMMMAAAKVQTAQTGQFKAQADAQNAQDQLALDKQKMIGEQQIAQDEVAREAIIHSGDMAQANKQHSLAVAQHNLGAQQASHDAAMDVAEHNLNVHQALNPPTPSNSGGNS